MRSFASKRPMLLLTSVLPHTIGCSNCPHLSTSFICSSRTLFYQLKASPLKAIYQAISLKRQLIFRENQTKRQIFPNARRKRVARGDPTGNYYVYSPFPLVLVLHILIRSSSIETLKTTSQRRLIFAYTDPLQAIQLVTIKLLVEGCFF